MITRPTLHRVSQQTFQNHVAQRTYVDIAPLIPCQPSDVHDFEDFLPSASLQNGNLLGLMIQDG